MAHCWLVGGRRRICPRRACATVLVGAAALVLAAGCGPWRAAPPLVGSGSGGDAGAGDPGGASGSGGGRGDAAAGDLGGASGSGGGGRSDAGAGDLGGANGDGGGDSVERPPPMSTLPAGAVCLRTGWCFASPLPHGFDYSSVWASSPHDAWFAAPEVPALVHADRDRWTVEELPPGMVGARIVTGAAPGDIWVVGPMREPTGGLLSDGIFHRQGGTWVAVPLEGSFPEDISVTSSGDVWVAAEVDYDVRDGTGSGLLLHYAGQQWTEYVIPAYLSSVWAAGPDDVWASGVIYSKSYPYGLHGVVYRLNQDELSSWVFDWGSVDMIRGESPDDVWTIGGVGVVSHWTGAGWQGETVPMLGNDGYTVDLEVAGPGDVWLSLGGHVYHRVSGAWQTVDVPAKHFHHAGSGEFLAGDNGELWFAPGDGGAPERLTVGPRQRSFAIWGTAADSLWALGADDKGGGALLHLSPAGTSQVALPFTADRGRALWASSDHDVWVVGAGGLVAHGDPAAGPLSVEPPPTTDDLVALWGSGPDDVWLAGGQTVLRWNGAGFERPAYGGFTVTGVAGSGANDVWVVGGAMAHFDGQGWTTRAPPAIAGDPPEPTFATAVWVNAPDDVCVGVEGEVVALAECGDPVADVWRSVAFSQYGSIGDLFGVGPGDIWASGSTIGAYLDVHASSTGAGTPALQAPGADYGARYWGVSPTQMWAVAGGALLRSW